MILFAQKEAFSSYTSNGRVWWIKSVGYFAQK